MIIELFDLSSVLRSVPSLYMVVYMVEPLPQCNAKLFGMIFGTTSRILHTEFDRTTDSKFDANRVYLDDNAKSV